MASTSEQHTRQHVNEECSRSVANASIRSSLGEKRERERENCQKKEKRRTATAICCEELELRCRRLSADTKTVRAHCHRYLVGYGIRCLWADFDVGVAR